MAAERAADLDLRIGVGDRGNEQCCNDDLHDRSYWHAPYSTPPMTIGLVNPPHVSSTSHVLSLPTMQVAMHVVVVPTVTQSAPGVHSSEVTHAAPSGLPVM